MTNGKWQMENETLSSALFRSSSMNQGLHFPAEFYVYLSGANFDDHAHAEFRMINAVTGDEPLLHRIGAQRPGLFNDRYGVFFRASGRRARRCGFGGAFTIDMIAAASATFDAPDGAFRVDCGNDVFTNLLAFSTIRVHIAPDLRAFDYTKRIFHHYFDPVSILSNLFSNSRGFTMLKRRQHPGANNRQ
jgi:hypothetical protein